MTKRSTGWFCPQRRSSAPTEEAMAMVWWLDEEVAGGELSTMTVEEAGGRRCRRSDGRHELTWEWLKRVRGGTRRLCARVIWKRRRDGRELLGMVEFGRKWQMADGFVRRLGFKWR